MTETTLPARMRRRGGSGHERWLVSYADLVTLLFAVFAMLYGISTVDAEKLSRMVSNMRIAFDSGGVSLVEPVLESVAQVTPPSSLDVIDPALIGVRRVLLARLGGQISQERVEMTLERRGLVVSIREAGAFALGSADLSGVAETIIAEVARAVTEVRNLVRVEGHTDDVPISTARFASNWELSTARATAVVAYLVERVGMSPRRLSAAGYSEFRPRVSNDTVVNRARNRRVDIVILSSAESAAVEPVPQGGP